jgi:hypothetical protein
MVEVIEAYRDFIPATNATATVEDLLASVPEEHLIGLWRVVLTNSAALTGHRKRSWSRSRGRKARHVHVQGLYHQRWRGEPAWIEVFVDKIEQSYPAWSLRLAVVRSVAFSEVVFHELGHHIHASQRPEHRDREDVADDWARRFARQYVRRRHRVVTAMLRPMFWARRSIRTLARRR